MMAVREEFVDRRQVRSSNIRNSLQVTVIALRRRLPGLDQGVGGALHRREHDRDLAFRRPLPNDRDDLFDICGVSDRGTAELQDLHILDSIISRTAA